MQDQIGVKISLLDSKIDAIRVDQQTMKDQQGDVIRMLVDLTKHVTAMKHSQVDYAYIVQHMFCVNLLLLKVFILIFIQAGPNTTNTVDESTRGVNGDFGNESRKSDNHSDLYVNEDLVVVSTSIPKDAIKDGDITGDTRVEMLPDSKHDLTRDRHTKNLSSSGTREEEPVSYFSVQSF